MQNLGLGTELIWHLIDIARKKGLEKIFLLVNTDNARAIHVHEKCGFYKEAKFVKEHYHKG